MISYNNTLTEASIDELVIADVDDDNAWEEAIHVEKPFSTSLNIPRGLADRASFLATPIVKRASMRGSRVSFASGSN